MSSTTFHFLKHFANFCVLYYQFYAVYSEKKGFFLDTFLYLTKGTKEKLIELHNKTGSVFLNANN